MVSPSTKESLLAYLAMSNHAVSAVLLVERDEQQFLVYYVSHLLARAEQ